MNRILISIVACLTFLTLPAEAQKKYFAGADFNGFLPIGSLNDRFVGTVGGSVYFGQQRTENWAWSGRFDIFQFTDINKEKLNKKINVVFNNKSKTYEIPLNKMEMNLSVYGVAAEGKYKLLQYEKFTSNINFGFGIYNWKFSRNTYVDSIFVDTSGTGTIVNIENLNVPKLSQSDWSGGISLGIEFEYNFINSIAFVLSGNYKLIIAELWPTLKLDLENVSGLQMFDLRAGFRYRF